MPPGPSTTSWAALPHELVQHVYHKLDEEQDR